MKRFLAARLIAFAIVFMVAPGFARGIVRGVVSDSLSRDPLVGANVFLPGTALGSSSDLEGNFFIDRVPPGRYSLRVSYIGYVTRDIPIQLLPNQEVRISVALAPDVIQGTTVVVTGQAYGQAAAINQQITSNTIVNVISEEKIQELPDANAAEAMGRLPGIALQRSGGEANRIVLRGLSDRFSSITVDGIRIAATDAEARGVDLSTISQGSLAGIELFKALTPDKDADAIAGSVNLVTKKAPSDRLLRLESKGSYNQLDDSYKQYDLVLRYGERFFHELLGVQVSGNLEQRGRSHENIDLDYELRNISDGRDWEITDFTLDYTDEIRKRNGVSLLLDAYTPDGGSIRFNNIFNRTKRDFITYNRNYPTTSDPLTYGARDREQEISTFNSFLSGENHFFGLTADWSLAYARSESEYPFDYEISFLEPSAADAQGNPISHMANIPASKLKGPPEELIPYALNNFQRAYFYTAFFRNEQNTDTEKTGTLNLKRSYRFGNLFSGEFKIGGKYRDKSRSRERSELLSPYYIEAFPTFVRQDDGTIVAKDLSDSRFADMQTVGGKILVVNFLDTTPVSRDLYDKYKLYPIMNRDAMREWWEINRSGFSDLAGKNPEYERNREADAFFYDITERVSAGYLMNTLNVSQKATLITGVRIEAEDNDYQSMFSPKDLSGFPVPTGIIRDTTAAHTEVVWLPNAHLTLRPLDFMNLRLAAYKAIARPNFNHRLESFIARKAGTFYSGNSLTIGNPGLRAAKAWNYEVNTSFFSNKIGLLSLSAYYKDIEDMFHVFDDLPFKGQAALDSLGIGYRNPFASEEYALTYPYNSSKPTRVWGFEFEHQTNLRFLPGFLKHIVLSYNVSIVRSETYIPSTRIVEYYENVPGIPFPVKNSRPVITETKQKLEGQPELFGNVAIGYDFRGFSARVSVYHQGEYNRTFSSDRRSDTVRMAFTRWDLALKQQLTHNLALILNVNNLSDVEEGSTIINRLYGWRLQSTGEMYGLTADLGLCFTM